MTDLNITFAALASVTRRDIIARLSGGEVRLSDLAAPYDMSQTAVTKHVTALIDAGLVTMEKRGRSRHCRLNASAMKPAADWLGHYEKFWEDQFASLRAHLEDDKNIQ